MVHELLLEDTAASRTTGQQATEGAARAVKATIKQAFWDSLEARLIATHEAGGLQALADDIVGLMSEVQTELSSLAPTSSQEGQQIHQSIAESFDKVQTTSKRFASLVSC
jgi:T-complex protein 11